jgi:hypothetical protein
MTSSSRSQAQYLRIYDGSGTYARWQGYYVGSTVTLDASSWEYYPFIVNGLMSGASGKDSGISISVPATATATSVLLTALKNKQLCEIKIYEFSSLADQSTPPASQVLITSYLGEVISMRGSFTRIEAGLGSALAPVGAQVPPRKFTNKLVGVPLRL